MTTEPRRRAVSVKLARRPLGTRRRPNAAISVTAATTVAIVAVLGGVGVSTAAAAGSSTAGKVGHNSSAAAPAFGVRHQVTPRSVDANSVPLAAKAPYPPTYLPTVGNSSNSAAVPGGGGPAGPGGANGGGTDGSGGSNGGGANGPGGSNGGGANGPGGPNGGGGINGGGINGGGNGAGTGPGGGASNGTGSSAGASSGPNATSTVPSTNRAPVTQQPGRQTTPPSSLGVQNWGLSTSFLVTMAVVLLLLGCLAVLVLTRRSS